MSTPETAQDRARRMQAWARALGYLEVRELPTGELAGRTRMLTTWALMVGIDHLGMYRTRFCYEHAHDCAHALATWDGAGDPPGPWVKEKPSDRLGPGADPESHRIEALKRSHS